MHKDKRGFIILISLFFASTLALLISVGIGRSFTELLASRTYVSTNQAFHLAEAGLDEAIWEFRQSGGNFDTTTEGWVDFVDVNICAVPTDSTTCCTLSNPCREQTFDLPGGQAFVRVINWQGFPTALSISSTAGTVHHLLQVIVNRPKRGFWYGLYGTDFLRLGTGLGLVTVDSYDCNLGNCIYDEEYEPGKFNKGSEARIGTMDWDFVHEQHDISVDLHLRSTATLKGYVYITPDVNPFMEVTIDPGATITNPDGETLPIVIDPPHVPPIVVPHNLELQCNPVGPDPEISISSGTQTISGDECFSRISIGGTAEVILEDGARIYLTDDLTSLRVTDEAKIIAKGNNQIFGEGRIWVRSKYGLINEQQIPRELQVRMKNMNQWFSGLEQADSFYGVLYMPRGWLWLKGNLDCSTSPCFWTKGEHYGAIIADRFNPAAHGSEPLIFHHDLSLEDVTLSGEGFTDFRILSWQIE